MSSIDSHVHIFDQDHCDKLAWNKPGGLLYKSHTIDEYPGERDIVFVEVDRRNDLSHQVHQNCIDEANYASSIDRVKAVIAWAPMPLGRAELLKYIKEMPSKVVGFRYLLQDKPKGTVLQPKFIESLTLLSELDLVFEFGIDTNGSGLWQLEECLQVLKILDQNGLKGRYIVDHMAKPPLRKQELLPEWASLMKSIAEHKNVYCKLSGCLTELPLDILSDNNKIVSLIEQPIKQVLEAFADRCLFGSDWPVCNFAGSYEQWKTVLTTVLSGTAVDQDLIWFKNAQSIYKINKD
ncbi:L-rhamnono-1,4-lactonase [Acrasis kona]|uniref:L-rhamnono-1,4-lactonase n=1 Tax=Acrasis kona TaxID=1008807 RepID=A0AAW2YIQ3_9EUKA